MEEYYILAKKIISSKYNENDKYYNMILVALTTLLYKYKDYTFLIEKIFNDVDISIEDDSIRNILKKKDIHIVDFEEDEDEIDEGINTTFGISNIGYTFILENSKFIKINDKPFIICNSNCSDTLLLNSFIHEFNHLIKGSLNNLVYEDLEYSIRCGIGYYRCIHNVEKDTLREEEYYDSLDEAINVIQTTEMMKNIELLQVEEASLKKYLDSLDKDEISKDFGYDLCVEVIRPLWENDNFRSLIEDNIVEGNIIRVVSSFDNVLGEGSFEKFADYLDDLDILGGFNKNSRKINKLQNNIRNMIKEYNSKTYYTYYK